MAKLTALLTLNTAGFQSALKTAKSETSGLKNSMAGMSSGASKGFASMGSAMKSVAKGTAVVAAAVAAAVAAPHCSIWRRVSTFCPIVRFIQPSEQTDWRRGKARRHRCESCSARCNAAAPRRDYRQPNWRQAS